MSKYLSIIILTITVIVSGCSTKRGAFAGDGDGIDAEDTFVADRIGTVDTVSTQTTFTPYDSLAEASTAGEVSSFTLQALAVQGNQNTNYTGSGALGWSQDGETSINVDIITNPAVKLNFNETGNISSVTAYFADKTYEVSDTGTDIITTGAQSDSKTATLTIDRTESFGFASNYMAHIGWNLERTQDDPNRLASLGDGKDRAYSINGSMIAGIESATIPTTGTEVEFKGKGRGFYSHVDKNTDSHATIFDITATIDFARERASVTSSNTMQCSSKTDCTTLIPSLEFSTQSLLIDNIGDAIGFTGNVRLVGEASFSGTLDSRFYGGTAWELGGIFAMRGNEGDYYYGAFGGERMGLTNISAIDGAIASETATPNSVTISNDDVSLSDAQSGDTITMKVLSVYRNDGVNYNRAPNRAWATHADKSPITHIARLSDSVLSLTFGASNTITGVTAYTDAGNINADTADRNTIFGFVSNYMAYIEWDLEKTESALDNDSKVLTDTTYDRSGMMIAGIETGTIIDAGRVDFIGEGKGVYGTKTGDAIASQNVTFGVTVAVDFDETMVNISTDNDNNALDSILNFSTGLISYTGNNINTALTLNTTLTGQLDARFYGAGSEEFGGAFALTEADTRYYYGAFGASRNGVMPVVGSKMTNLNAVGTAGALSTVTANPSSATSLTGSLTLQGLAVSLNDVTNYTRYKDDAWTDEAKLQIDRQITANRVADSGVLITFGTTDTVTTIFADKNYSAGTVTKSIGSFTANHLVLVEWGQDEVFATGDTTLMQTVTDIDGMMIAGIETGTIIGAGRVDFTGKGKGVYGTKTGNVISSQNVTFGVMATVDFDEKMVNISTDNDNNALDSILNFSTGLISYTGNNISTSLTLDSTLTGMLDARFYGAGSEEFGGAFALAEAQTETIDGRYYYGAFGASRMGVAPFVPSDTTTLNAVGTEGALSTVTPSTATELTGNLTLKGLAVSLSDVTDYVRYKDYAWNDETKLRIDRQITANRVTDSGALITFGTTDTVTKIFADKDYSTGTVTKSIGSFTANYLVLVEWDKDESFATGDTTLMQTITDIDGMMIAGIETGSIPTAGIFDFTGKGKGVYGTKTGNTISSQDVTFDVTAQVDFGAKNVAISTTETTGSAPNFNTGAFSYTGNNISTALTLNSALTGTLDARFYGGAAQELGGAFALTNANNYYYGAFGTLRQNYTISAETLATTDAPAENRQTLTSFNDGARNGKTNVALKTTAVLITRSTADKTIINSNITGGIAQFSYDSNNSGNFATGDDNLILYLADKKYSATAGTGGEHSVNDNNNPSADGNHDAPDKIELTKQNIYFGFTPTYMALVKWNLNDSNGYGIAGYETISIPSSSSVVGFTGKGQGHYYSSNSDFNRYFDITANVNFVTRNVSLSSTNTCSQVSSLECGSGTNQKPHLNFTGTLSYAEGANNITGSIKTQGNDGDFDMSDADGSEFTGTADARFYGPTLNELGGTFSLTSDIAGYVGYFGAQRQGYFVFGKTLTTTVNKPTENRKTLTGFNDGKRGGKNNVTLKAHNIALLTKNATDQTIINSKITGAIAQFDYGNDSEKIGWFAAGADNFTLYVADKKYSTNNGIPGLFYAGENSFSDSYNNMGHLWLTREAEYFNFTSNYMAGVFWELNKADYTSYGYGITGYETADYDTINIADGTVISFTGGGRGRYTNSSNTNSSIYYDITANVNFDTRNISLSSQNTCTHKSVCGGTSGNLYPALNFSGSLSYAPATNTLTGTVTTAGNIDDPSLTGTADAKFYGAGFNELGGTFNLINATAGYVGFFGAKRDASQYFVINETLETTYIGTPETFNKHSLTGFNASNINSKTGNALKIHNAVLLTKSTVDKAIISSKINGAVAEFDYASNGKFNAFNLYFADKKYNSGSVMLEKFANYIQAYVPTAPTGSNYDAPGYLLLSRHDSAFGFVADYMAYTWWAVDDETDYVSHGYGMTGYETGAGNAILTTGTKLILTGRGTGIIDKGTSAAYTRARFSVTAITDFANRTISLSTEHDSSAYAAQNITGTLSYAAGENKITGNVETVGNVLGAKLKGTAEAKFYGPAAEELGGTFSVTNTNASYIGYFGVHDSLIKTTVSTPATLNKHNLTGFNASNIGGKTGNALKVGTTVQVVKTLSGSDSNKPVTVYKTSGAVAEFNYDGTGKFNALSFYFSDKKYRVASVNSSNVLWVNSYAVSADGSYDAPTYIEISRSTKTMGFEADYMAQVWWDINKAGHYNTTGYAITGFETDGGAIPKTGTAVSFTGKGYGYLYKESSNNGTTLLFTVGADVDFVSRNINLTTNNTCASGASTCGNATPHPNLNLSGTLNYAAGVNNITGTVKTDGTVDGGKLTGTADARFYGPAAEEFGGTFNVSNDTAGYVGYFSAKKP